MNIVLIGYRGSGKTTVGKGLAEALWKEFVDTDVLVCKKLGNRTIAAIWEELGEPAFRAAEVEVTKELLTRDDHVIALGGGTVIQPCAREALLADNNNRRIYLACDAAELQRRIEGDAASRATRPNLTATGGGLAEVERVLTERDPIYRATAHITLDVTRMEPKEIVTHIVRRCL